MKRKCQNRAGFTLVEVVAVLALSSLGLVFAAMLFVTSTSIFISTKEATEDAQKIQFAMNRLVKEMTFAGTGTVVIIDSRTVGWTSHHPDRFGEVEIATWNGTIGSDLTLQGTSLLDNVSLFAVSATADSITLTLRSARNDGVSLTTVVHPRYDF